MYQPQNSDILQNNQIENYDFGDQNRFSKVKNEFENFFNTDIDTLMEIRKFKKNTSDVNNLDFRKMENPESFNYENYFDGFHELQSLGGADLPHITHLGFKPVRHERKLNDEKGELIKSIKNDVKLIME